MGALHVNGQKATGVNIILADGVFMDVDNEIVPDTTFRDNMSYTATEDCAVVLYLVTVAGASTHVKIDGKIIRSFWKSQMDTTSTNPIFVKKGQVFSVTNANESYDSNYTVYGLQTGTIEGKLQPVIYSTEEREVGVWTDGKPLYQKTVIKDSNFVSGANQIVHNISNIEKVISDESTLYYNNGDCVPLPVTNQTSQGWSAKTRDFGDTYFYLDIGNDMLSYVASASFTLLYTKTTDTAGAGTWTPDGAYTHHYSTDEKVVGTYEGETLYERNIDIILADSSDMQTFAPGTLGIGLIKVIIDAYFKNSSSQQLRMSTWYGNNYWSYIVGSNGGIMIKRNASDPNWTTDVHFVATVQYTKSS